MTSPSPSEDAKPKQSSKWFRARLVLYAVSLAFVSLIAFTLLFPSSTTAPEQRGIDLLNIGTCISPSRTLVAEKMKKGLKSIADTDAVASLDGSDMCPPLIRSAKLLPSGNIEVEANIALAGVLWSAADKIPIARREVRINFMPHLEPDKPISWTAQGIPEEAFPRWFLK